MRIHTVPLTLLKRTLVFAHRWLGVALSVILLLWFVSGIVMLYHSYPSVRTRDRLQRLPNLDPGRIRLSAGDAFAALGSGDAPGHVLLTSFDGRPVYLGAGTMIYADDGREHRDVDDAMIDRAAAAWSGRPFDEATKTAVGEADQWTLSSELTWRVVVRTLTSVWRTRAAASSDDLVNPDRQGEREGAIPASSTL
jgi:hypothetical protein